jgi:hypothetical protein
MTTQPKRAAKERKEKAVAAIPMNPKPKRLKPNPLSAAVGRSLRRAAKAARKTARMHGTPIYIWRDGKVVAIKP